MTLFADEPDALADLRSRFCSFEACVVFTRREALVANLERLIPRVVAGSPSPEGGHAARSFAEPIRLLGATPPDLPPDLEATATEHGQAEAFCAGRLRPGFVALHPGSGSRHKNWPTDRFAALVRALALEPWLLVEGPADLATTKPLAELEGCVRARELPLRTLGALLARAGLFVGNDSGVTHLAAAWGAPTLALFGPTDPRVWSPVGRHAAVVRSPTSSMDDLPVAEVLRAARALASQVSGARTSSRLMRR